MCACHVSSNQMLKTVGAANAAPCIDCQQQQQHLIYIFSLFLFVYFF